MTRSSTPSQLRWYDQLRSPHSLQRQIMGLLGLTYLATLVLILAVVVASVNRAEVAAWRTRQAEAAHNASETVSNFLQRAEDALKLIGTLGRDELTAQPEMMHQLLDYYPALLEVVGLDAAGKVFASGYQDRAVLANLFTIPQSQWFNTAKAGQPYYGGVHVSSSDKPYLIIALPSSGGGVIAARLSMDVLWNVVANIRFGNGGSAYVVDQDGAVIAHTDPGVVLAQTTLADHPEVLNVLASPDRQWFGEYRDFEGTDVVGVTNPIGGTAWTVVTELPQTEAYQYSRNAIVLIGGALLAISVGMLWLLRHNLKRLVFQPMEQLRIGAERIGQGDLNYRVGLIRRDEIGQVSQAFDEMAERLQGRDTQLAAQAAALRDSEARYRAIVEDQTELICRWQPEGTLTFVNEAYCRYFDRTRAELLGHSFMPLIPEEDHDLIKQAAGQFSPDHPVVTFEHRVILPDGNLRWQQWTDRALYNERGQIVEFASVGRDITERRQAEEALRASETRLRMALNAGRMLAWDFDVQASALLLSDNAAEIWGEPVNGLDDTLNILHPEDKPDLIRFWANALTQGGEHTTQFRVVSPGSGAIRWMEARGRVTSSAAGAPRVGGVIFDITTRKEAEEEIKRLNADLEQRVAERTQQFMLANASLLDEVAERQRAEWRSAAFASLAQRLNSALNPQEAARIIFDVAHDLLGWDTCFLALYSADQDVVLHNVLLIDTLDGQRQELVSPDTSYAPTPTVRRVIEEGPQLILLHDWATEQGDLVALGESEQKPLSLLFVPIRNGARAIGVLSIQSYAPDAYDRDDLDTLQALADHCSNALERIEAERALREAEARYRLLVEQIPAVTYIAAPDENGTTLYVSPQIETMLGYLAEEWLTDPEIWRKTVHPADWDHLAAERQRANTTGAPCNLVYRLAARDGRAVWVNDQARLVVDHENGMRFWQGVMFDITERRQAEEQIRASLREKEVLLKEIHHRVKNNLQVISSLLSLQSRQVTDVTTLELLRESQNRVRSMALIHEKLYQSDDLARVDFAEYVRNLAMYLFRSYKASPAAISLAIDTAPDLRLSLDTAIPCGLIVNELVSNALKHAFPDGRAGEIRIAFDRVGDEIYTLRVRDNGVGFPAGFDFRQSTSLGLQLVNSLIGQLDGSLEQHCNGGTEFIARFSDVKR